MIAYHVSRQTAPYKNGSVLHLNNNFIPNNPSGTKIVEDLFPDGVSMHGQHYLSDFPYESSDPCTFNDVYQSNTHCSTFLMEFAFEMVRRIKYPLMPSRFQSFFALEKLDDLKQWPELTNTPFVIYEIDVPAFYKLDASFLQGGIALGNDSETSFYQCFSPGLNWNMACNYWSGIFSHSPKPELLVPLPVTIKNIIRW